MANPTPAPSTTPEVRIRRLKNNPDLPLPARASGGAAGYDVRSADDDFSLEPGQTRAVATGLALELPAGVECQVRPRSGLALRSGITIANAPGTIDPDYRGEVKVILHNLSGDSVRIARGDRIAQLVFARFEGPLFREVDRLDETSRSGGGFGSTGVQ